MKLSYDLKKLFYLLMILVAFASCRNDFLQENKANQHARNISLTSKIISVNQSKHKEKLLSELKSTKNELNKSSSKKALGKLVNYGDSVSINTDHVIYIENGNYHNYIFKIEKNNFVEGDPIENLLLTPLPDGSYKEFLVFYYINKQEQQAFEDGNWEIPQNRIKVVELLPGTYNNGQLVQTMDTNCVWTTVFFGYTTCTMGIHSNGEPYGYGSGKCEAPDHQQANGSPGLLSQPVYGSYWNCGEVPVSESLAPSNPPSDEGGGSPSSGGTGGNYTECLEAPTNPNDPSTGIGDDGGCQTIIPYIPNLGDIKPKTPCEKTKALLQNPQVKAKMDSLNEQSKIGSEKGYNMSIDGSVSNLIDGEEHRVNLGSAVGQQGGGHNHTPKGIKMFSATDIGGKLLGYVMNFPEAQFQNAFFQMVGSDASAACGGWCYRNYIIRFTGNAQDLNTFLNANFDFEKLIEEQKEREMDLQQSSTNTVTPYSNILNNEGLEKLFFETLKSMNMQDKVMLQRIEKNNNDYSVSNITQNSNGTINAVPCP